MQAENTYAVTLRSRPLFSLHQTITLGAAVVAGSVFFATHLFTWQPSHTDEPAAAAPPRADHPYGALVYFAPEPPKGEARVPSAVARAPMIEIDPEKGGVRPTTSAPEEPVQRDNEVDRAAPLPPRRPQSEVAQQNPRARREAEAAVPAAPAPDNRGFFERMFNIPPKDQQTALAYASPQDGVLSNPLRGGTQMPMGYADGHTAVYDISAKTVFMPNGEKLEAHSGLGDLLDDPSKVHVKNRGATPPNVYDLSLRESLFHGVRALRLNPVSGSSMYGRDGMLAHTYMLGPKGDSNGCVSFREYDRFLNAYLNGEVKRLVVVQRRA